MPTVEGKGARETSSFGSDPGRPDLLSGSPEGRGRWVVVVAALAGVVLGAAAMQQVDSHRETSPTSDVVDVRLSLGAHAGDITGVDGDPVVSVPLVISNEGTQTLTLSDIRVDGPGAALVLDPELRPRQPLPATLVPGRDLDTRITIRSDCSERLRPVPVVTLVLVDSAGQAHEVPTDIPGLAAVWGQTLAPLSCPPAAE
jgi:hypothetical protein